MAERLHYYQAIEMVYIWAIDDARFSDGQPGGVGLVSEPDFWRRLYVRRPALKRDLRKTLSHANAPVYLVGRRGQGKTTIVVDIARQFERRGHIVLYIDVRHDPRFSDIGRKSREELSEILPKKINNRIISLLEDGKWRKDISSSQVLAFLMEQPAEALDENLANIKKRFEARRESLPQKCRGESFGEWLRPLLNDDPGGVIRNIKELGLNSISARDFILAAGRLGTSRGVLICFDNVDSIGEHDARDALREYIRGVDKHLGPVPRILVALRDENYRASYLDDGSGVVPSINLRNYDEVDFILPQADAANPGFDERVTQKRFEFVQELVVKDRVDLRSDSLARNLPYLQRMFLEVGHVEDTLGSTCNGNRRRLSAHLSNFIEYLYQTVDPHFGHLLSEGEVSIESYRDTIETQLLVYLMSKAYNLPAEVHYNYVRWVSDYRDHGNPTIALARHYILMHLCGILDRRHPLESRISTAELVEACKTISLDHKIVSKLLTEFGSGDPDKDQLIESSRRHHGELSGEEVGQHELLSRARYLATVGSRKLCFAAYVLHKEGRIQEFNSTPLEPFSPAVLSAVLGLTIDLGEIELLSLAQIRDSVPNRSGASWLESFRRDFGRPGSSSRHGELLTEGLLSSYVKFLASSYKSYGSKGEDVLSTFRLLQNAFENRVAILASGSKADPEQLALSPMFKTGRLNRWRDLTIWE